jgi:hypothetical protein
LVAMFFHHRFRAFWNWLFTHWKIKLWNLTLLDLITFFNTNELCSKHIKKTVVLNWIQYIKKSRNKRKRQTFSWDYATEMKTIKKDSLYELTTTFETGYTLLRLNLWWMIA